MGFRKLINSLHLKYLQIKYKNLVCGRDVTVECKTKILIIKGEIHLSDKVYLRSQKRGYHGGMPFETCLFTDIEQAFISIGYNSRINGTYIHAQAGIKIGKNVVIAAGVNIIDSNGHEINSLNRTSGRDEPKQIIIGDNVWIGLNSIVLKGTNIGNNCVVGAGSVVKGVFPENSIIAGNPAIIVRNLDILNENRNS
jgi:acetyltransferase-like isoleucine patch superfamily enzyme